MHNPAQSENMENAMSQLSRDHANHLSRELLHEFSRTGPDTLGGRYMRRFWHPVHDSDQLAPGQAKPIRIMSEDFTLYRGKTGVAHLVANRCAHRSTQLSTGWVEDDSIRCLYHGWKFDGTGRCIERPGGTLGAPGEERGNIKAYPTREHLGLVFAYLGEGDPPAFPPYPAFEDEGLIETRSTVYPCNFFQTHENNFDPCHILWSHSHGVTHADYLSVDMSRQEPSIETDYGILNNWVFGNDGMRMSVLAFMPNAVRLVIPTYNGFLKAGICPQYRDSYLIHVPIDDEQHIFFRTQMIRVTGAATDRYRTESRRMRDVWASQWRPEQYYTDEILAGRMTLMDIVSHPYLATIQDQVAQSGQGRSVDRSQEHLTQTDRCMVFYRRIVRRELAALADGLPLKQWQSTADCSPLRAQKDALIASGAY
jgi:5,5'-dehydrodivanillate O-demethylase oxygenase subunit